MNCPYCNAVAFGFTGLLEVQRFVKHLAKCQKNPNNIVLSDGKRTVVTPKRLQGLEEALEIREKSGQ